MRVGMTLEIATIGGVVGSLAVTVRPVAFLAVVFAVVVLVTSALMLRGARRPPQRHVEDAESGRLGWGGARHSRRRIMQLGEGWSGIRCTVLLWDRRCRSSPGRCRGCSAWAEASSRCRR